MSDLRSASQHVVIPCGSPDAINESIRRYLDPLARAGLLALSTAQPVRHQQRRDALEMESWAKQIEKQLRKHHHSEMRIVLGLGFGGKVKMDLRPGRLEAWCDLYPEDVNSGTEYVLTLIDEATAKLSWLTDEALARDESA